MRLFVALSLDDAVVSELMHAQKALKPILGEANFTSAEKLHLTFKFLGTTTPELVPAIEEAIKSVAVQSKPASAALSKLGNFPPAPKHPRIVWAGLEDISGTLTELAQSLDRELASLGFPPEERPFHPHITLARLKGPPKVSDLSKALANIEMKEIEQSIRSLTLFSSETRPEGASHVILRQFPF